MGARTVVRPDDDVTALTSRERLSDKRAGRSRWTMVKSLDNECQAKATAVAEILNVPETELCWTKSPI